MSTGDRFISLRIVSPSEVYLKSSFPIIIFVGLLFCKLGFSESLGLQEFIDPQGYKFQVSIVNRDTADMLFNEMAGQPHIPFKDVQNGCWSRAHEMAMLLEKKGYLTGKAFMEGDFAIETPEALNAVTTWGNHVAPFILVQENDQNLHYVIDPSVSSRPITVDDWEAKMTQHPGGRTDKKYYTSRFHYMRFSQYGAQYYLDSDINDTRATLGSILRSQVDFLNSPYAQREIEKRRRQK